MTTGVSGGPAGYRIVRELGRGGMGVVHEAIDEKAGRRVALKTLNAHAGDMEARERFEREALAAASVRHVNLVVVHASGFERGRAWIAYELLEGGTLADRLKAKGRLSATEAAKVGSRIARALEALHGAGIVHRDVKPANVLFDASGNVKLGDLGLARSTERGYSLTVTGAVVGTLAYLSPEQANPVEPPGPASDLYSLGATLYALLTGEPPFKGSDLVILRKHMLEKPTPLAAVVPECPPELAALVERLLAKDPKARGTAGEVARILEAVSGEGPAAVPRSIKTIALLAGLAALAVGGAIVAAALRGGPTPPPVIVPPVPPTPPTPPRPGSSPAVVLSTTVTSRWPAPDAEVEVSVPEAQIEALTLSTGEVVSSGEKWRFRVATPGSETIAVVGTVTLRGGRPIVFEWFGSSGVSLPKGLRRARDPDAAGRPIFIWPLPDSDDLVLELVYVPPGEFLAGDPPRTERIDHGYFVGRYEVLRDQFGHFAKLTGGKMPRVKGAKEYFEAERQPVAIPYARAEDFCRWASVRLPSGLEWEKAARGVDGRRFPWGAARPEKRCNAINVALAFTPAGSFDDASPWGAHDMAGNVAEWCTDPCGPDGKRRMQRGGFCGSGKDDDVAAATVRDEDPASGQWTGFRVVKELPR